MERPDLRGPCGAHRAAGRSGAIRHRNPLLPLQHPRRGQRLAELVRGHWSIENRCHWVLDVVFGEDHCQVRDPNAARNLSILREAALKAPRTETSKGTLSSKRKRAALDPQFRLTLLLTLQA